MLLLLWSLLQLLDIAGNQLTEIPEGLPESLEYLYLQNNKISAVPANAFDSTPNLKGIFLRWEVPCGPADAPPPGALPWLWRDSQGTWEQLAGGGQCSKPSGALLMLLWLEGIPEGIIPV